MELFSEIYGVYYKIVTDILREAPRSLQAMRDIASQSGFAESTQQLLPKLLGQNSWPLLVEKEGKWQSRLSHSPRAPLTLLEKRWLKAVLGDPRAALFLEVDDNERLSALLAEVEPLFQPGFFRYFDQYLDGDPYESQAYIQQFHQIARAIEEQGILTMTFRPGTSQGKKSRQGHFAPLRLVYSEKDDKFRVHCGRIQGGRLIDYSTINLGRILEITPSKESYSGPYDLEGHLAKNRSVLPLIVEIAPERNATERFMVAFPVYEKQSMLAEETGICTAKIWYPRGDETEVLITLLGFGPVVKVLSPPHFVAKISQRVGKQTQLNAARIQRAKNSPSREA